MKNDFPFHELISYEKKKVGEWHCESPTELEDLKKTMLEKINQLTWEDFVSFNKNEMELLPANYIYDWARAKNSKFVKKIPELYSRYYLQELSGKEFIDNFDENVFFVYKNLIADPLDLEEIFTKYLVYDKYFISLIHKEKVYSKWYTDRFSPKSSVKTLLKDFRADFHNGSRGYLIRLCILKYVSEKMDVYKFYFTDQFFS